MPERGPTLDFETNIEAVKQTVRNPVAAFFETLETKRGIDMKTFKQADVDFEYLTPEQRAETYWSLFQEAKGLFSGRKKSDKERLQHVLGLLKKLHSDEETQKVFQNHYDRHLYEIEHLNGDREKYRVLRAAIQSLEAALDASTRDLFSRRGEGIDESHIIMFEVARRQLQEKRCELDDLLETNPELSARASYETLRAYARDLRTKHFIWSLSRRTYFEDFEEATLSGKPILASGESGTGKTELVKQGALILTGQPMAETPGKDIRFQDLIAKPKIAPDGSTYYEYKEIGEAFTGKKSTRDEKPIHNGLVVADDEWNLLDPSEQNTRLSRIASWTTGTEVRMPVTNTVEQIAPNALYCAMVNLASERYVRKPIPPEALRKFAKVNFDYPPQTADNPELYEMLLSALIDGNGRMRATPDEIAPAYTFEEKTEEITERGIALNRKVKVRRLTEWRKETDAPGVEHEVAAGGFLWRFSNAWNELNKSFSRKETVLEAKGEAQYFDKLVLDMKTVLKWLTQYRTVGREQSLESFMWNQIEKEYLSQTAYTQDDRDLLKEFLAHFSITPPEELEEGDHNKRSPFRILTPQEVGLLSPRVKYKEILSTEPVMLEGSFIDELGQRIEYERVPSHGVDKRGLASIHTPGEVFTWDGKRYEYMGIRKDTGEAVYQETRKTPKREPKRTPESGIPLQEASELIGPENLFGPEALRKAFGIEVRDVPSIPFSRQELERAKIRGEMLILRVDKAPDGSDLTMEKMNDICTPKFQGKGKILFKVDWYANEDFYKKETCRVRWALVDKEILADSTSKNYLQQTELISEDLKHTYQGQEMPQRYKDAIQEFEREKQTIEQLLQSDLKEAARKLAELEITKLTRQTAQEVLFDFLTVFLNTNDKRLLEQLRTWTATRASDGFLVDVGRAGAGGALVGGWGPDGSYAFLGVLLSRS